MKCLCGCGDDVLERKYRINKYINGHNKGMKGKPGKKGNNNVMSRPEVREKHLKIMKEKVWCNKERNKKISEKLTGKKPSKETLNKLSLSHLGHKNSPESKLLNSIKQKELMAIPENREKRRVARQNQIIKNGGGPSFGKNEIKILNELEELFKYKIIRQHRILGYWIDGYIPELNLAIEIDERPKTNERDVRRENEIRKRLGCEFLRIEDKFK